MPVLINEFLHNTDSIDLGVDFEDVVRLLVAVVKAAVSFGGTIPEIYLQLVFLLMGTGE